MWRSSKLYNTAERRVLKDLPRGTQRLAGNSHQQLNAIRGLKFVELARNLAFFFLSGFVRCAHGQYTPSPCSNQLSSVQEERRTKQKLHNSKHSALMATPTLLATAVLISLLHLTLTQVVVPLQEPPGNAIDEGSRRDQ
jgi:hypothetical protein